MPQIGSHLIIAEEVRKKLGSPNYLNRNREAFNLGAVGPDLHLFLFDRADQQGIINTVMDVYKVLRDIDEAFDAINDALIGPAEDLANWFTGGLHRSLSVLIRHAYEAFKTLIISELVPNTGTVEIENPFATADAESPGIPDEKTIKLEATDLSSLFHEFGHPYSSNPQAGDYRKWWWVDLLHYRRTGSFAQRLLSKAGNDDLLKAYATGYWTHVGADLCGHPFVNAVVGGPFRNHVIRHMVIENVIDAWLWNHYRGESLAAAGLESHVDVGGGFEGISGHLLSCMKEIYTHPVNSAKTAIRPAYFPRSLPDMSDMERAYERMLDFLELSTNLSIAPPVPPPSGAEEFFQEIGDEIVKSVKKIGDPFKNANWLAFLFWPLLLFQAAVNALVTVIKILTIPAHIIAKLSNHGLRYGIYLLQLELYEYAELSRWGLVLAGWGKAASRDLDRSEAKIFTKIPSGRGGGWPWAFQFPYAATKRENGYWLMDPPNINAGLESPLSMEASPYQKGATPDCFVTGPGYAGHIDSLLKEFAKPKTHPGKTYDLQKESIHTPQFGNAVDFSVRLINGSYPPGSFDLDSDRGYGHLCWEGPLPTYIYSEDLL